MGQLESSKPNLAATTHTCTHTSEAGSLSTEVSSEIKQEVKGSSTKSMSLCLHFALSPLST